jgi:hypothetical protein
MDNIKTEFKGSNEKLFKVLEDDKKQVCNTNLIETNDPNRI